MKNEFWRDAAACGFLIGTLLFFCSFNIHSADAATPEDYGIVGDAELIEDDTTWTKDVPHVLQKWLFVVNGATLTIEAGTVVELGNADEDNPSGYMQVADGTLKVLGTESEPVRFIGSGDQNFSIDFFNADPSHKGSFLRYAIIGEGGDAQDDGGGIISSIRKFFATTVFAQGSGSGMVGYFSGKVRIENTVFMNKYHTSVYVDNAASDADAPYDYLRIVNSNFISTADTVAIESYYDCPYGEICSNRVLLKNNWYGAPTGPNGQPEQNPAGEEESGTIVNGGVVLDGYRKNDLIADPLVVIPGITGSAQVLGQWQLDPITHIYDDLIDALKRNGYEEDVNLFPFPYEWRNTNKTSALYLQAKIEDILQETRMSKVDIAAHSMGGLVARAYIEEIEGTQYDNTIDQLITLGTPQRGSPEAYLKWEAGEGFFTWKDKIARHHFEQEAEEAGYDDNLKGYIQDRVVSVRELLPDHDYLFDVPTDQMRTYPGNYPLNSFLEDLNDLNNIQKLDAIRFTGIIGKSNVENTLSKIRVVDSTVADQWEHGMPENFYDINTDQGLEYDNGDETVPLESAKGIAADSVIEMETTHNELPTMAQCEIIRLLTGSQDCSYEENWHIPNLLLFNVFSPIDIQIVSPSGKRVGKNFETGGMYDEIPGAYYTGYDTQNEFITVPNPEDGEYQILTEGTGEGDYRIEAVKITEGATPSDDAKESVVSFEGTATQGVMEEKKIELLPDDTVISGDTQDITAPTVDITSPENTTYFNNEQIPVVYVVSDDVSSEDKIAKEVKLDDALFDQASIDLSLHALGSHTFAVRTADEAGNEATQSVTFENTVTFASLNANVDHYFSLGLIKKRGDAKHIHAFLRHLETVQGLLDVLRQTGFFPFKAKDRMIRHLQKERDHKKKELIKYLSKKVEKGKIDPQANNRIVEAVEMLVQ